MDATTARLVDFSMRAAYRDLPAEAVHECKRRLIDTLACAVAAYDVPLCDKARAVARRYVTSDSSSTVLGCDWKTLPEAATFANGVMMRYLDLMDTYLSKTRGHPCDVMSGVLAVGEAVHANGRDFINALTLAYDVYCTFCETIDINSKGWDQPVCVALATVAGVGRLLGLNREQMGNAVALALVPNMTLFRTRRGELAHWKGCAAANGARNAVFAAYLASDDISGPTDVFEGKYGLWDVVGRFDWQFTVGDGAPHRVTQSHMKCFPVVYHAQPVAWVGIDLRKRVQTEDIRNIDIETYHLAVEMNGTDPSRWAPKTRETADHSLPYILAIALLDGTLSAASFHDARLTDPAVAALMSKVRVHEDKALTAQYPAAAPCRVRITLNNGEEVVSEVVHPKGHNSNPIGDADLERKFRDCYKGYGSDERCEAALRGLWALDNCEDISHALNLFARTSAP